MDVLVLVLGYLVHLGECTNFHVENASQVSSKLISVRLHELLVRFCLLAYARLHHRLE